MATKKNDPKELKYYDTSDDVYLSEYTGCCGIEIANNFIIDTHDPSWANGPALSLDQLHKKFYKAILDKRECRHIQVALVSKYKDYDKTFINSPEQIPGFIDFLKKKKWTVFNKFVNPNHGNEVTVLYKVFPKKKEKPRPIYNWGLY